MGLFFTALSEVRQSPGLLVQIAVLDAEPFLVVGGFCGDVDPIVKLFLCDRSCLITRIHGYPSLLNIHSSISGSSISPDSSRVSQLAIGSSTSKAAVPAIRILFDDHRLVANAGLLLPATLARHLGLRELVDHHLDLGGAPGRANTGDKMLTLVASALAGGDCIDDADALRAGGTVGVLGCVVKASSTLGTFLRSFRWGHVRQLDRVSRQLLARAWAAGAGPGDSPLTIDLDSTICETYGLAKEGARHHGYTGARGYHPLLAIAAGTGEVLMSRLREGRANTARGAAHFLRETVGRVRYGGARGQLTVRADSGFYAHTVVAACREMDVRFSITIRQRASLRDLIEAIPEEDWTPIPYWMDGAADVAETTYTPFQTKPDAAPVRLIVRRVKPTPGSQLALFARYSYHAFITDRDLDSPPRRGRERHTRSTASG